MLTTSQWFFNCKPPRKYRFNFACEVCRFLFYLSLVRSTYRISFNNFRYLRKVTKNPVNTWTVYNCGRFTCHVFCFDIFFSSSIWLNLRSKLDFWVVKKAPTRKTTTSHLLRALQAHLVRGFCFTTDQWRRKVVRRVVTNFVAVLIYQTNQLLQN